MVEWRCCSGWTEAELAARLAVAGDRKLNFEDEPEQMTLARGWNRVRSEGVAGREQPGKPVPDGSFVRAVHALEHFEFSDPRIVIAHFAAGAPLRGRRVLLEIHAAGQLHFLCPVLVEKVCREQDGRQTVFGFRLATLRGHVERGREWFLLIKDHRSGEVRFRIEADWRAGEFPNWWSRLGFLLTVRRYQRAWHHMAHVRVRRLVSGETAAGIAAGLEHEGPPILQEPVSFYARRARGAERAKVEREGEMARIEQWVSLAAASALAGVRSMLAPALLVRTLRAKRLAESTELHALTSRQALRFTTLAALGEMAADKTPWVGARTARPSLLGRALSGALVAGAISKREHRPIAAPALLGACAALAATFASYRLRMAASRRIPAAAAGALEDALAIAVGAALSSRLRSQWTAVD